MDVSKAPDKWLRVDGSVVSCTESVKVLNENWEEANDLLQEMYEDAVLLGCGKEAFKAELTRMVSRLNRGLLLKRGHDLCGKSLPKV